MTKHSAASEWAAGRGEKWRAQLAGMEAMLKPVDDPLVRAMQLDAPCRIADVGCGGGGTTLDILRRAPAGSVVHGFDISPALIEFARARHQPDNGTIAFDVANVATAAPPKHPYDQLVSRFGIMFYDDPAAAFANLINWLAPGGRFAFAVWGPPADNVWFTTVRDVVAGIIDLPQSEPDAPGPFRYGTPDRLQALLDRSGFSDIEVRNWRGELAIGGGLPAAEAATFALASFSSFGELIAKAGEKALTRARQSLTTRFSGIERNGTVRLNANVHLVTGARPSRLS